MEEALSATQLASKKRHAIQVASRRSGVSVELLRAWERRYGAVEPSRTDAGRRLYSDDDIERLRLIREALTAGRRIGDLATLPVAALKELIGGDGRVDAPGLGTAELPTRNAQVIGQALDAIVSLDQGRLRATLIRAARSLRPMTFVTEVAVPVMRRVGSEWHRGAMPAANEHLVSAVLRQVLGEALENLQPLAPAPMVVVATPSGERHEIGALSVAIGAATEGWRVLYLGADLPASDIVAAVRVSTASLVALSVTVPGPATVAEIETIARDLDGEAVVMVGGQGLSASSMGRSPRVVYLTDLADLRAALNSFQTKH